MLNVPKFGDDDLLFMSQFYILRYIKIIRREDYLKFTMHTNKFIKMTNNKKKRKKAGHNPDSFIHKCIVYVSVCYFVEVNIVWNKFMQQLTKMSETGEPTILFNRLHELCLKILIPCDAAHHFRSSHQQNSRAFFCCWCCCCHNFVLGFRFNVSILLCATNTHTHRNTQTHAIRLKIRYHNSK